MKDHLYELTGQMLELQTAVADHDDPSIFADTLEAMTGLIEQKAEQICFVIKNFDPSIEGINAEIERLQARKKTIAAKQDWLTNYLRENMERCEIKKIECPLFSITLAQGREIAVIDNQDAIPDEFVKVKTSIDPDKNAIAAALKDGREVPGAHLERAKSSIRIK